MTGRIAAGLGGGFIGAAIFEGDILDVIDMFGWVDVLILGHVAEGDGCVVALKAAAAADGFGVAVVAGETGEQMSVMGVGLVGEWSSVGVHGHGG